MLQDKRIPMTKIDAATLTASLIRCPSVTPIEGGALDVLSRLLSAANFECTRVDRGEVSNLFARWGPRGRPQATHCAIETCRKATREGKPFCSDHVERHRADPHTRHV